MQIVMKSINMHIPTCTEKREYAVGGGGGGGGVEGILNGDNWCMCRLGRTSVLMFLR